MLKRSNPLGFDFLFSRSLTFGLSLFLIHGFVPSRAYADTAPVSAPAAASAPAASSAVEALEQPEETSTNITLDFKEADINTVLRVLSIKSGVNIIAGPEVQGTVTIRLENVPWDKALEVLLRTYDYVFERDDNIIRVTTREKMAQEPVVTQTYILNYTKATEIQAAVKDMLTERGRIQVSERTNAIVITDIPTNLYRIGEIIKKLDKVTPQAFIDSKVIRTDVGVTENIGIAWNVQGSVSGSSRPTTLPFMRSTHDNQENVNPYLGRFFPENATGTSPAIDSANARFFPLPGLTTPTNSTYSFGTLSFSSFSSALQLLRSRANTKVVSNPRVSVLNNQTAKVQVGQQIPLPTFARNQTTGQMEVTGYSYRDIGVVLNVTPHINSEEEILVDLKPEVSSNAGNVNFGAFQIPSFNITTAITQLLIRSGETIAIGGLLTDNTAVEQAKIPYLGDIPFFGKLFRSKRQTAGSGNLKTETLFFVTVTLVDSEGQPAGAAAHAKDKRKRKKQLLVSSAPVKKDESSTNAPAPAAQAAAAGAADGAKAPVETSSVNPSNTESQAAPAAAAA